MITIKHKLNNANEIIELEKQFFLNDKVVSFENCRAWFNSEPLCYFGAYDNNKLVGYLCCIPLKKDFYNDYKNGITNETKLTQNFIEPYKVGDNFCLLEGVGVLPEYRTQGVLKMLLNKYKNFVIEQKENGVIVTEIIADCVTVDGEKFMMRTFDAKKYTKSHWGNIYLGTVNYQKFQQELNS